MRSRYLLHLIFAGFSLFPADTFAGDDVQAELDWLTDFFRPGIGSVSAQYAVKIPGAVKSSDQFYKRSDYTVQFDFASKTYSYAFIYEYRDSWSALTNNNTTDPPKQQVLFVGSKVTPWNVTGDVGIYREEYDKKVPNWFVFDDLDSLFLRQCMMHNPPPAITGMFYADEFKALKRMYKQDVASGEVSGVWTCFEFDTEGNVVGISPAYMYALNSENLLKKKNIEDYSIVVRNTRDEAIFLEILVSSEQPVLMEGVGIRRDKHKINIYNFELNSLLHKFVPELVENPRDLIQAYAENIQRESDKELLRFETTENK